MSSLAAVFVQAIIPRRVDASAQTKLYKQFDITPTECVYCGATATDKDHFRAIVSGARPSGFFHTEENIVPSCGRCNQSKGGSHWKAWMESTRAKNSPTKRLVEGTPERVTRLSAFAAAIDKPTMTQDEMRQACGDELWNRYWARLEAVKELLDSAQEDADLIAVALGKEFEEKHPRISN